MAYVLRFIENVRANKKASREEQNTQTRNHTLTVNELDISFKTIVRLIQQQEFREDLIHLERFGETSKTSPLSNLTPFIDKDKLMRVGGRIEASNLSYQAKHPLLLPYNHPLTKSFLNDLHQEHMHVGAQALLAIARQNVWPIKGKILARSIVQNCVRCARTRPKLLTQLMGDLPKDRVQPARPFINTGIDFCGPIWIHYKIRGKRPTKAYIAVFCCFATKATHLEVVSDLTTQSFIAALKRFMARRGHCKTIYCDNGTNFVGAKNLLEMKDMLETRSEQIASTCSVKGIEFKLIPPRAPHFGGLWEAAVKSAKHLLQKSLMSASLTYEELETVVCEAEAILNSRPLTPLSADLNDLKALTPGHFLIGEPLTNTIDQDATPVKTTLVARWKLISHNKNEFWRRWLSEYLNQLQHRYRWKQKCQNAEINSLVLVKEDNVPALKWPLGRIVNIIKGNDGLVRVADVRTSSGIIRRPIHKLAPLPIEPEAPETTSTDIDITMIDEPKDDERPSAHDEASASREELAPRKRKRTTLGSAIVTLLMACLVLPTTSTTPIKIQAFTHQPGIYFENLGTASIIANEWNLVVFYDMRAYWKEHEFFQSCIRILEDTCNKMAQSNNCEDTMQSLKHLTQEIAMNNMLLPNYNGQKRVRRGALNIVGNVANALFGVLDSEYAENMERTIDKIQQNENHMWEVVKNQTTIMNATLNLVKKSEESIRQQFNQLETHMSRLTDQVNHEIQQQQLAEIFSSVGFVAVLTASNFLRIQNAILTTITDSHNGKVSPVLISPIQLEAEIIKIRNNLPPALRLPMPQEDILSYYTLITIEGRITNQYAIFRMTIPLISAEEFELFKVIPIPVSVNGSYFAIKPSYPFLAINLHRDQYYPMTEHEIQSCILLKEGDHLCKQRHPIYKRGHAISKCEIELINNLAQSSACQTIKINNGEHWIQLQNSNQWIYALPKETVINVVCEKNTTQHHLNGTGILQLQNQCIIKQPLITIQSQGSYSSSSRASYTPANNLTVIDINNTSVIRFNNTAELQTHASEISHIMEQLLQIKGELPYNITKHDAHQFAISYIALLVILLLAIILAWRYYNKVQTNKKRPRPLPRRTKSTDLNLDSTFEL